MRIVFMGTPDFSVPSLDILLQNGYDIAAVITTPDKPAGRGKTLQQSAVKQYALQKQLSILQPDKLKNPDFIAQLKALNADLFIVVAFRMLPEVVWNMPPKGTFNLHSSLLPQYRGAAPINWAVINGEKQTGVTTFFLQHEIDTGNIAFQEKLAIGQDDTAGDVHDRLMLMGAELVLKTVRAIEDGNCPALTQKKAMEMLNISPSDLKEAPKIFKEDCRINWDRPVDEIHNFVRGLNPYPSAFTELDGKTLKVFSSRTERTKHSEVAGSYSSDGKTYLRFAAQNGYLYLEELQLQGKKRMTVLDFLKGYRFQ